MPVPGRPPRVRDLQPIEMTKIYPLGVFEEHSGLGKHSLRSMRRAGLRTIKAGGRTFIRGCDFHEFLGDSQRGDQ